MAGVLLYQHKPINKYVQEGTEICEWLKQRTGVLRRFCEENENGERHKTCKCEQNSWLLRLYLRHRVNIFAAINDDYGQSEGRINVRLWWLESNFVALDITNTW